MPFKTLPRWRAVSGLPEELWDVLESLPRTADTSGGGAVYPCAVEQADGTYWPCVLFVEKEVYHNSYRGTYGMADPFLDVRSVVSVLPSPYKTPIPIEKRMYSHGETHMGGFVVTFLLKDGTRFFHSGGDFCEFVGVPPGYVPDDIVDVVFEQDPKISDQVNHLTAPDWKWCVFERPERQ